MYTVKRYPTLPPKEIERRMAQRKLDEEYAKKKGEEKK